MVCNWEYRQFLGYYIDLSDSDTQRNSLGNENSKTGFRSSTTWES